MTTTAQSVIKAVVTELQDATSVRWPIPELVGYLNDGQREIANLRPDMMVTDGSMALAAGAKQSLPSTWSKLIDIQRNTGGSKNAVRLINREILDAQIQGWQGLTGVTDIKHYMYDVRDPRVFWVYPPAAASGASLEGTGAVTPTDVTVPGNGTTFVDVTGNISVPDEAGNALREYVLFRAYNKDAEYASDPARADRKYAAFGNCLGLQLASLIKVAPTSPENPNAPPPKA